MKNALDAYLLKRIPEAKAVRFPRKQVIYSQGDSAHCVYNLQRGYVKLTVVTREGKEGVVALLRDGDLVGEGCISTHCPVRSTSAVTLSDCCLIRIERGNLLKFLRQDMDFCNQFLSTVINRSNQIQEQLVDHLFYGAEKRLARILLSLARVEAEECCESKLPEISQETLAEIIGTSRPRVNIFMNRFKKLGLVEYGPIIKVKSSLSTVLTSR